MARQPLVLVPGLLNTRRLFEAQIEGLGDLADVTVPEIWRHDTIGAMAREILATAPPRFALGGFSMGGYVSFEVLRQAPERVERLALMDTQATPDTPEHTANRRSLMEQCKLGRFKGVQPSLLPNLVHPDHLGDPAITQPILDMAAEVGVEGFLNEQKANMVRPDSRPMLVDIKVPTVVIVGREDHPTPLARSLEMAADIAHARLVVIEKCGHMSTLEHPGQVTEALRRWLTQ
ncbi:MAG TPA: alpha/beta hydrolase [Reyranella sp.]|nr:alpha/beta hydrolase [Reyranella sp.]